MMNEAMTPQKLADMPIIEFIEKVKNAGVSDIKLYADLLKMASGDVQSAYYQLKVDTQMQTKQYDTEEWNKLCDLIAQLGGLVAQITLKLDICAFYFHERTPDCFKKK